MVVNWRHVVSCHYQVVHYVTDPFVRENYVLYKDHSFVYYFVFDEKTREDMILLGGDPGKVYVTGLPLSQDLYLGHDPLGLRSDMEPETARNLDYDGQQGIFYCGIHWDLARKLNDYFTHKKGFDPKRVKIIIPEEKEETKITDLADLGQDSVVIIVGPNLRNLIPYSYMTLNHAQVVCTKPSGDNSLEALQTNKLQVLYNHQGPQELYLFSISQ